MKKINKNTIVHFQQEQYDLELKNYNDNLEMLIRCEDAFQKITNSRELKSFELLEIYIKELSGFPNIEASVKLLDFEQEYNYLKESMPKLNLTDISTEKKEVNPTALKELKERHTVRLSNETQIEYDILLSIADLYSKLSNIRNLNAISSYDYINYDVNIVALHNQSQIK